MSERKITRLLAAYASEAGWAGLPDRVKKEVVRAAVNWFGCALGGCRTELVDRASQGLQSAAGKGDVRVIGRPERFDLPGSAFINCLASGAYVFDDTHVPSIVHPTAPVASTLFSIADTRCVTGVDFLTALAIGMEVECRIGSAIRAPGSGCSEGWFMTGIAGAIGAAAGAGKLLGLQAERMTWALGIAVTQAGGMRFTAGSMCSYVGSSFAARSGVTAACLAAAGFTCSDNALEGTHGLVDVLARDASPDAIVANLAEHYEMLRNVYKPYPCGVVIHPVIDACLEIARLRSIDADSVAGVEILVHPLALSVTGIRHPSDGIAAMSSVFYWVAACLVCAEAGIEQLQPRWIEDEKLCALQHRIQASTRRDLSVDQASVVITLKSGERLTSHAASANGRANAPMSDQELDEKFLKQATRLLGASSAAGLLADWRRLPDCPDVRAFIDRTMTREAE